MAEQLSPEQRKRIRDELDRLSRLMDASFNLPGTDFKIGLDPIIGLIPGIGDSISLLISAYIVLQAHRLGASRWTLTRMVSNIVLDAAIGAVPVLGDLFDFAFKANQRNLKLLRIKPEVIDVKATPL